MRRYLCFAILAMTMFGCSPKDSDPGVTGTWEAWLDSPGGKLQFNLALREQGDGLVANLTGGDEVLHPSVVFQGDSLLIDFPHFDATIVGKYDEAFDRFDGHWRKRTSIDSWGSLEFHAVRAGCRNLGAEQWPSVSGRWAVNFESSDDIAVAVFETVAAGEPFVKGTILTTTGDYRYLWGEVDAEGGLQLQAFDGAHAFLFKAELQADGTLSGDFWSRDSWHETWTAVRDDEVSLPDAFELTTVDVSIPLASLSYPDLDGELRSLEDPEFAGRARIIEVFGTWCPNCYDATRYLIELDKKYRDRGLSILGLAFEVSGDFDRDASQVRRYIKHHGIEYPILVAGVLDKAEASSAFPLIDRVRSYPTFLFIDADNQVQTIYTGFSGPATGAAHSALREAFERKIEELLGE